MSYRLRISLFCILVVAVFSTVFGIRFSVMAQSNNSELDLPSGTYIPGYTNSKWPSWGKLGSLIGGVPIDPVNKWAGCEGHDPNTCWNVASTTYKCPVYSQTYEYAYNSASNTYKYYVPFEFIRPTDVSFVSQYVDMTHIQFSPWCVPEKTYSPIGGKCGDGNINIGEQCDPPGRSIVVSTNANGQACPVGSYMTATCSTSCKYTYSACTAQATSCGNGRVEGSEQCDAGAQNGKYGSRCTAPTQQDPAGCKLATAATGQYCGNGTLDRTPPITGKPLEFCEEVNGACIHLDDTGHVLKSRVHILLDRSGSMYYCLNGSSSFINGVSRCSSLSLERWSNTLNGLDQIYNSMSSTVQFSLSTFNGSAGSSCYSEIGLLTTKPSIALAGMTPTGGTPTNCAINKVFDTRQTIFANATTVPKKLILITDGLPSDTGSVSSTVKKLNNESISTYVVAFSSLSSANDIKFLNDVAEAGGTGNPTSAEKFFVADKATEFVTAFGEILGCFEYSQFKQHSCSWDCQGYGEYCGDGIVQTQDGETCDLGAQNGIGACSTQCKVVVPASSICGNSTVEPGEQCDDGNTVSNDGCSSACSTESTAPRCGDGKVDPVGPGRAAEQCDLGSENGTVCIPGYDRACTYCASNCTNVTLESTAFCGNGRVDYTTTQGPTGRDVFTPIEKCDYDATHVYSLTNGVVEYGEVENHCPDKGSFACTNSCQKLDNNCVSCTNSIDPSKPNNLTIPKISILNPMTEPTKSPYTNKIGYVDLLRKKSSDSTPSTLSWIGYRKINYKSEDLGSYIDPFEPYYFILDAYTWQPLTNQGIQTNPACNGEYVLLFNKNHISQKKTGSETAMSSVQVADPAGGLADLFDYEVSGQSGEVVNEVVMSPAVAPDTIRIVTRWKKKEQNSALFYGTMYQDKENATSANGNTFSYFQNVFSITGRGTFDSNCGIVKKDANGYYIPDTATNGMFGCRALDAVGTNPFGRIWMHKILDKAPTLAVQAVTLSANGLLSSKPFGFYVASPDGPMNQYTDYDLWVDVYTSHPNAVPEYSIYQPTYSFSIDDAIPSTDLGPLGARYWHVFNLTTSGATNQKRFTVLPIGFSGTGDFTPGYAGQIVQDECRVRANMPDTTQCGEQIPFSLHFLNVSPTTFNVLAPAGSTSTVITSNVSWTITTNAGWLHVTSPASGAGAGNANITFTYDANTSASLRTGTITVTDGVRTQIVTVNQVSNQGILNSLIVSPTVLNPTSAAGNSSVTVTSNVTWTATSNATSWLTVSPASGVNNGTVTVSYTLNTLTTSRTGTITFVGGGITRTVTVTQVSGQITAPSIVVTPPTQPLGATLNSIDTSARITANVDWFVAHALDWLLVSPAGGTPGTGVVLTFKAIQANTGSERCGQVKFSAPNGTPSQTITVCQAGTAPSVVVSNNTITLAAAALSTDSTVTVTANVNWTAVSSNTGLVTVTPASGGTTGGILTIKAVTANTGATERTLGMITVAGPNGTPSQIITVKQSGTAPYLSMLPPSPVTVNVGAAVNSAGSVSVSSNIVWDVVGAVPSWLSVSPMSSTGNGVTLNFITSQANPLTTPRSVTFTVTSRTAGVPSQMVTVTQAGAATTLTASPTSVTLGPNKLYLAGTQTALPYLVQVTSNANWTISNVTYTSGGQNWFTATQGSTGVSINYSTNTSGSQRSGVITVTAGGVSLPIQVTQPAVAFTVASSVSALVGTSTSQLSITSNVPWSVTENTPWITSVSPSSGTGNATITISYNANNTQGIRNGVLDFKAADVLSYKQTTVAQQYFYLVLPPAQQINQGRLWISPAGGSVTVSIKTNAPWQYSTSLLPSAFTTTVNSATTVINGITYRTGDGILTFSAPALGVGESTRNGTVLLNTTGAYTLLLGVYQGK